MVRGAPTGPRPCGTIATLTYSAFNPSVLNFGKFLLSAYAADVQPSYLRSCAALRAAQLLKYRSEREARAKSTFKTDSYSFMLR
jgi:hypothetical protein